MELVWPWSALLVAIAAISGGYAAGTKPGLKRRLLTGLCILLLVSAIGLAVSGSLANSTETTERTAPSGVPAAAPAPITATVVRQLNAVDSDGTLREGFTVKGTARGSCDSGSEVLLDAYRCSLEDASGFFVADPCLPLMGGTSTFCISDPWERAGTVVDLESPVNFDPAVLSRFPATLESESAWAIEVADPGDPTTSWHCLLRTGVSWEVAGNVVTWNCVNSDGSAEGAVLNVLGTDQPVWRALLYDPGQPELVWADVISVWN